MRNRAGCIVLLRAIEPVGEVIVDAYMVELCRCNVVLCPVLPPILCNDCSSVVADDHALRICWVDPEVMMVAMVRTESGKGASAICTLVPSNIEYINSVSIERVGIDMVKVPWTLTDLGIRAHA